MHDSSHRAAELYMSCHRGHASSHHQLAPPQSHRANENNLSRSSPCLTKGHKTCEYPSVFRIAYGFMQNLYQRIQVLQPNEPSEPGREMRVLLDQENVTAENAHEMETCGEWATSVRFDDERRCLCKLRELFFITYLRKAETLDIPDDDEWNTTEVVMLP